MGRRHVFEVEESHVIGRGVHLTGEKMGVRGNLDAALASRSRTLGLLAIIASTRALGFPSLPPQAPQSSADSIRIIVGGAAMGAEEDDPREVHVSPIMRSAVSTVRTCSSSVKPVRVIRSFWESRPAVITISAAESRQTR